MGQIEWEFVTGAHPKPLEMEEESKEKENPKAFKLSTLKKFACK